MRADITCPLRTMTNVTAVTERRKQNTCSRRPAQKTAVRSRLRRSAVFRISDSTEQGLMGKFVVPQLANNFHAFYVARRFTTAFTTLRHLSLSLARSIRSAPSHTTHISLHFPSLMAFLRIYPSLVTRQNFPKCRF